jgi:DHA1 family inner membrane transport protein
MGIAGGSLAGGLVLNGYGARATALVGGLVALVALFVAIAANRQRRGARDGSPI